jgi:hypothetical protein
LDLQIPNLFSFEDSLENVIRSVMNTDIRSHDVLGRKEGLLYYVSANPAKEELSLRRKAHN